MFGNSRRSVRVVVVGFLAVAALVLSGCESAPPPEDSQQTQQKVTEDYMKAAIAAVPYPLSSMVSGGWLERTLLKEHLLRQNNAHRRAFVTLMSVNGQPIVQFPIQGMVFDQNSQMTTTDIINKYNKDSSYGYAVTTPAAGDNGTWGPEPSGVAFFTVSGMEVKWNGIYLETDAPMVVPNKPVLVYDPSAKPTSTGGIVSSGGILVKGTVVKKN